MTMPFFTTACPRNCYSTCSLRVEVENGRLRRVEPHPDNLATPEGACLKGLSYVERVRSPERILYPLRRKPGTSGFERISWDEALDLIVSNLTRIRAETGSQGQHRILEAVRRLHHHLRRSLLASRPRGNPFDAG
jgi:anaerobic selenocysteine-containing dehydrogenase